MKLRHVLYAGSAIFGGVIAVVVFRKKAEKMAPVSPPMTELRPDAVAKYPVVTPPPAKETPAPAAEGGIGQLIKIMQQFPKAGAGESERDPDPEARTET